MKRFLKVSIILMLALFATLSLFACTEEEEGEHVHEYGEWEVIQEPSCTVAGSKKRTCVAGDAEETEEIPATGHTEETLAAVEPDCTHTGLTEGKRCSVCKEILVSQKTRAALGHSFSDWTVVTVATCTAVGERMRVCSVCGVEERETLEKVDHTYASNGLCKICGAELEETAGLLYLSQRDGSLSVSGYEGNDVYVVIPEWHDEHRVTSVSPYAFSNNTSIKAVTVPKTVTSIGLAAFTGCTGLTEISLPDSVSEIGMSAFYGCSSLASFKVPGSLKSVSYEAFSNCTSLTNVSIPSSVESIGAYAFRGCRNLTNISLPDSLTGIGDEAFSGCDSLEYNEMSAGYYLGNETNPYVLFVQAQNTVGSIYEIVENTKIIYSYVFSLSRGFETVVIPSSVTYICPNAFFGCALLEQVSFAENSRLTGIGASAFSDCGNLRSFEVPAGVKSIGYLAFGNCNALSSLTVASGNVTYEAQNNCIIEKNTKTLVVGCSESIVPDDGSVTSVGEGAFYYCAGLTRIVMPASVENVRSVAFSGCENIVSISGSDYVAGIIARQCGSVGYAVNITTGTSIAGGMFKDCTGLTDVEMASTVTTIEPNAFEGCIALEEVRIPETVTVVGSHAFEGCTELSVIVILGQVVEIAPDAFYGCEKVKHIKLPAAAIDSVTFRDNLETVEITTGENIAASAFRGFDSLLSVTLPRTLLSIGASAFDGCENLAAVHIEDLSSWCKVNFENSTANPIYYAQCVYLGEEQIFSLVIPDDVTDVSNYAFYNGRTLTKLVIPETVESVGDSAFYGCIGFDTITLPTRFLDRIITKKSLREVHITSGDAIADNAFSGCDQLLRVVLPNTVKTIGAYAFQECAVLQSVTIPSSVIALYNSAFYGCVGLKEIHIESIEAWCRIDFTNNTANPLYYGKDLYFGEEKVERLEIPENVLNVSNYAFYNCTSIKEIKIYDTIQSLRTYTFTGCTSIETAFLPISVLSYFPRQTWVDVTLTSGSVIPEAIFADCVNITDIRLPETVTDISENAFSGCTGLTRITLPDSVRNIAQSAFTGCSNIQEISLPTDALGSVIFKDSLRKVTITSGTEIIENAFANCRHLEEVTIADTVTTISDGAFLNCIEIAELCIPNSVVTVADHAFIGCSGISVVTAPLFILDNLKIKNDQGRNIFNYLTDVTITSGTSIGNAYFTGQTNLRSVSVSAVTEIGANAFSGCTMLEDVDLADCVVAIGKGAFSGCIRLQTISLPVGVTTIAEDLFSGCTHLVSLEMSPATSVIGAKAFSGCSALTSIDVPSPVSELALGTFYNCSSLESISLPFVGHSVSDAENTHFGYIFGSTSYQGGDRINVPGTTEGSLGSTYYIPHKLKTVVITNGSILAGAFENCAMIDDVTLPGSATAIGDRAFKGCTGLRSITIPETVTSIGNDAFNNCAQLVDIVIPAAVTSLSKGVFYGCRNIESMTLPFIGKSSDPSETPQPFEYLFSSTNENEANSGSTWVPDSLKSVTVTGNYAIPENAFKNCAFIESITLNMGITTIGNSAFAGCDSLVGLILPTSLTSLGSSACKDCKSLTEIAVPDGIARLADSLFEGCSELVDIALEEGLTSIGSNVFNGCQKLVVSRLPSTVAEIGEYAFNNCYSITEIVLPDALTVIDVGLFQGCNNLRTLPISESIVSIRKDAFNGCTSLYWAEDDYGYYLGNELKPRKVLLKAKSTVRDFIADASVEFICNAAFGDCYRLESLTVPFVGAKKGDTESREEKCLGYFFKSSRVDETYQEITQFSMKVYVMPTLTKVTVTGGVIGTQAFSGFSRLTKIVLEDGVTSVESAAFKGCSSLTDLTLPFVGKNNESGKSYTVLGYIFGTENYAGAKRVKQFYDYGTSSFETYFITESLTQVTVTGGPTTYTVSYGAFYNCNFITAITLSSKVTGIGGSAFEGCAGIKTVRYDGDIASWCALSFNGEKSNPIYYAHGLYVKNPDTNGYKQVVDLVVPATVPMGMVANYAFCNCENLLSLTLEEGVTRIGNAAFSGCTHLRYAEFPSGLVAIGNNAFNNCYRLVEVCNLSALSPTIGTTTYGYVAFYARRFGPDVTESLVRQYDGGFVIFDDTVLIDYSGVGGEVVIPDNVTEVNQYAFYGHDEVRSIRFGDQITTFGQNAFDKCSGLEEVRYLSALKDWFDVDFANESANPLYSAHKLYYTEDQSLILLETLTVPAEVSEIKDYAFFGCVDLTEVHVGSQVAAIGNAAFGGCEFLQWMEIPESYDPFGKYFGNKEYDGALLCGEYYLPKSLTTVNVTGGTIILENAFKDCHGLVTIGLPEGLTTILSGAFIGCTNLRDLAIPSTLESLGKNVFDGCVSLSMNEWQGGYYLGNEQNPYFVLVDVADRWCSELKTKSNPEAYVTVEYCDCDPFSSEEEELTGHRTDAVSVSALSSVDEISRAFAAFMQGYTVTDELLTFRPTGARYTDYLQFFDKAKTMFSAVNGSIAKNLQYTPSVGTVIGVNRQYEVKFDDFYYYKVVENPSIDDVSSYYEYGEKDGAYVYELTFDTEINDNKTYYVYTRLEYDDYLYILGKLFGLYSDEYRVVEHPTEAGLSDYYEYVFVEEREEWIYQKTYDMAVDTNKIYYEIPSVTQLIFERSQYISDAYLQALAQAEESGSNLDTLSFNGAILTESGLLVFPYAFQSSLAGTLYAFIFIDESGMVSAWISDIPQAMEAVNFRNDDRAPSKIEMFGRCKLFKTAKKDVTTFSIQENTFFISYGVLNGSSSLLELSVPFVGANRMAETYQEDTFFGYLFGHEEYEKSKSIGQKFDVSDAEEYEFRIPSTLNTVLIQGGDVIRKGAFYNFDSIIQVSIAGIKTIEDYAFYNCYKLIEIYNKAGLPLKISRDDNGEHLENETYGYMVNYAENIYKKEGGSKISKDGGVIVFRSGSDAILMGYIGTDEDIILTDVTEIYRYAFYNNVDVKSIVIPDSVKKIGGFAFSGCSADVSWDRYTKTFNSKELAAENIDLRYNGNNVFETVLEDSGATTRITSQQATADVTALATTEYGKLLAYLNYSVETSIGSDPILEETTRSVWFKDGSTTEDYNAYFAFEEYFNYAEKLFNASYDTVAWDYDGRKEYTMGTSAVFGITSPFLITFKYYNNLLGIPQDRGDYLTVIARLFGYEDVDLFITYATNVATALNADETEMMTKFDGAVYSSYTGEITVQMMTGGVVETAKPAVTAKGYVLSYVFSAEGVEDVLVNVFVEKSRELTVWISNVEAAFTIANQNWWCSYKNELEVEDPSEGKVLIVEYDECDVFVRILKEGRFSVDDFSKYSGSSYVSQSITTSFDALAAAYVDYRGAEESAKETKYDALVTQIGTVFGSAHTDVCKDLGYTSSTSALIYVKGEGQDRVPSEYTGSHNDSQKLLARLFGYGKASDFATNAGKIADGCINFNASTDSLVERLIFDGAIYTESEYFVLPYAFTRINEKAVLALVFVTAGKMAIWVSDMDLAAKACNFDNTAAILPRVDTYGRCMLFETPYDPEGDARVVTTYGRDDLYKRYTTAAIDTIGESAFREYQGTTLILPDTIETIEDRAFADSPTLKHLFIPESISAFGTAVFENSENIAYNNNNDNPAKQLEYHGLYLGNGINEFIILAKVDIVSNELKIAPSTVFISDNAFRNETGVTKVSIPESVKSIGKNVFDGCNLLEDVTFNGSNLISIGDEAFKGTKLESVILPESLVNIGKGAFNSCVELESIVLPFVGGSKGAQTASEETLFGYIFGETPPIDESKVSFVTQSYGAGLQQEASYYIPKSLTSVKVLGGDIYYGAFSNALLKDDDGVCVWTVTFGADVGNIAENAFYGCVGIKEVRVGSVDAWLGFTFGNAQANPIYYSHNLYVWNGSDGYEELTALDLDNTVTQINAYAFYNCEALDTLIVANENIRIGSQAFEGCSLDNFTEDKGGRYFGVSTNPYALLVNLTVPPASITSFTVNSNTTAISESAFKGCVNLTSVTLPSSLATVENELFYGCTSLTSISLPDTVTEIKKNAFLGSGLTSVSLPSSLESIGEGAFRDCVSLATVTFNGASLTSIGKDAFRNVAITTLSVPDSVATIGEGAFRSCSSLADVTIGSGVTAIGENAFENCNNISAVNYFSTVADWFGIDFGNQYANPLFLSTGANQGILILSSEIADIEFTVPGGTTEIGYQFTGCKNLRSIAFTSSVTSVGDYAFYGCNSLCGVTLSPALTSIGEYAFYGCSNEDFTTLIVPDLVASIGQYAFGECSSLTKIDFGNNNDLRVFSDGLFYHCGNVTQLTVTNYVDTIGKYVFYGCAGDIVWDDVDNPQSSVEVIDEYAFSGYLGAHLIVPDGVNEIGARAFENCINITSIALPDTVQSIGSEAFYGCYSLTEMTLPFVGLSGSVAQASSTTVLGAIFGSFPSKEGKTSPKSVSQKFNSGSQPVNYTLPGGMTNVTILGGNILYGAFYDCGILTNVTVCSNVASIGSYAFYGCSALTEMTLPFVENNIGDVFGATSDNSSLKIKQNGIYYYFPSSLNALTILGGNISSGAFYNCSGLTSITLPADITSIGDYAFYSCSDLASLTIPADVTTIGQYAFNNCTSLTSLTVPDKVESIGQCAFSGCNQLASITLPVSVKNIGASAFNSCPHLGSVYYKGIVNDWCQIAFADDKSNPLGVTTCNLYFSDSKCICRNITAKQSEYDEIVDLTFDPIKLVTKISDYAFVSCSRLTSVRLPATIISVTGKAFYGCSGITEFIVHADNAKYCAESGVLYAINNRVKTELVLYPQGKSGMSYEIAADAVKIGDYAFYCCAGLANITIPAGVNSIGMYAFYQCSGLAGVTFGDGSSLTTIGSYAFAFCDNNGFTAITLPTGLTTIGSYAFQGCSKLQSVVIGEGSLLQTIGSNAFYSNTALTSINLENAENLDAIGSFAFYNCNNAGFTSITLPESLTSIGSSAFRGCNKLTSIHIPKNVTSIGDYAFDGCSGLRTVAFDADSNLNLIGNCAFRGCDNDNFTSIVIPDSVTNIGSKVFYGCSHLEEMTLPRISASSSYFGYIFNGLTNASSSNKTDVPASLTSVTITGDKTNYYTLPNRAFYDCDTLVSITIGRYVTVLGEYAFANCDNLTAVDLSNATNLQSIGSYAFANCNNAGFVSIAVPATVTSIGKYAFNACVGLTEVIFEESALPSATMTIGDRAFNGCNNVGFTSITLPRKTTSIGERTFQNCAYLTQVDFTRAENLASIGEYAFNGCTNLYDLTNFENAKLLEEIGAYAFNNCFKNGDHTDVTLLIPSGVKTIGNHAFSGCSGIIAVDFSQTNALQTIDAHCFVGCVGLTSISIPSTVTSIGAAAFNGCNNLTELTLPFVGDGTNEHTDFGYIYNGLTSESNINVTDIPNNIVVTITGGLGEYTVPQNAFKECGKLVSVTFGEGVNAIGISAFESCAGLTNVTVPNTVTSIGRGAFEGCSGLTEITLPFTGSARNVNTGFGFIFNNAVPTSLTTVTITGGMSNYSLPNNAFSRCTKIEAVILGENVTSIGDYVFSGCTNLISVTMNSVTRIGNYAFYNCTSLTSFTVPDTVTSVGYSVFAGCSSLLTLTVPFVGNDRSGSTSKKFGRLFNSTDSNISGIPNGINVTVTGGASNYSLPESAFDGCSALAVITLGANVTESNTNAFKNCANLSQVWYDGTIDSWCNIQFASASANPLYSGHYLYIKEINPEKPYDYVYRITLPATVKKYAFYGCYNLAGIVIPSSLTAVSIGTDAFTDCFSLVAYAPESTNASINSTVEDTVKNAMPNNDEGRKCLPAPISSYIFKNNDDLILYTYNTTDIYRTILGYVGDSTSPSIPSQVRKIGAYAFYNKDITSVSLPSDLTTIGEGAFCGCASLTSVTISNNVTVIGNKAFYGCTALATLGLTNATSLRTIGKQAFSGCTALAGALTLPSSVTTIGEAAFENCTGITSVTLSSSLTSLGAEAFSGCNNSSFTSITVPNTVTYVGSKVFYGCSYLKTIELPFVGESRESTSRFGWIFNGYTDNNTIGFPTNVNNYLVVTVTGGSVADYALPDSAFYGCAKLGSITLGNNVARIGAEAFSGGCSALDTLVVSTNLEYVGNDAFGTNASQCNLQNNKKLNNNIYYFDSDYRILCNPYSTAYTSVSINSATRVIYQNAFKNNIDLTSVTIPSNVKNIGTDAFSGCSSLKTVTYGDLSSWTTLDFNNSGANPTCNSSLTKIIAGSTTYRTKASVTVTFNANDGSGAPSAQTVTSTTGLTYPRTIPTYSGFAFRGWSTSATQDAFYDFTQAPYENITLYARWQYVGDYSNRTDANIISQYNSSSNAFNDNSLSSTHEYFVFTALKGGTYTINYKAIKSNTAYSDQKIYIYCYKNGNNSYFKSGNTAAGGAYSSQYSTLTLSNLDAGDVIALEYYTTAHNKGTYLNPSYVYPSNAYLYVTGGGYPTAGGKTSNVTLDLSSSTKIGSYAFAGLSTLTSVTLGSSLKTIGNGAFYNCTGLAAPSLSNATNLDSIGSYAFNRCNSSTFTSITIPSKVTTIGDDAFENCSKLQSVNMSSATSLQSIGAYAFYNCTSLTSVTFNTTASSKLESIGKGAFAGCNNTGFTSITIPNSVTSMGEGAFYGCTYLANIGIPFVGEKRDEATKTFSYLFSNWDTHTVTYPSSVNYINVTVTGGSSVEYVLPENAFKNVTKLRTITLSGNVSAIGDSAFEGCTNLAMVNLNSGLQEIGAKAFYGCNNSGFTSITIPNSVTSIGREAFYTCNNLATIMLPFVGDGTTDHTYFGYIFSGGDDYGTGAGFPSANMTVTITGADYDIPANAFKDIGNLRQVNFRSNILTIGDNAFDSCTGLTTLTFTDEVNLTSIGEEAFYRCSALTGLSLTNATSLQSIGSRAFQGCRSLRSVAFNTTSSSRLTSIGAGAFAGCNNTGFTSITIPNSVTSMGEGAFYGCTYLANIGIPFVGEKRDEATKTFSYLFSNWDTHTVTYPSSVNYINVTVTGGNASGYQLPKNAFSDVTKLRTISLNSNVSIIGDNAFSGCSNLITVNLNSGLQEIGEEAFLGCNNSSFATITVPNTVERIGASAFSGCNYLRTMTLPFVGDGGFANTNFGFIFNGLEGDERSNVTGLPSNVSQMIVTVTGGYIDGHAFENCEKLKSITLSGSVEYIGEAAFKDCTSLSTVSITDDTTLSAVLSEAFSGCYSLTSISIPSTVTDIGGKVFYGCNSLASLTLPFVGAGRVSAYKNFGYIFNGLTGDEKSNTTALPSLVSSMTVTINASSDYRIPESAFEGCGKLSSVTLRSGVKVIGVRAFSGCDHLTSFTMNNGVTTIGQYAFADCVGLSSTSSAQFAFSSDLTTIGDYAFMNCTGFVDLVIPDSVTSIGEGALNGCNNLTTLTIPFVGGRKNLLATDTTKTHLFGYIFGSDSYGGGYEANSCYSLNDSTNNGEHAKNYIPTSLVTVTVNGGYMGYGAFDKVVGLQTVNINTYNVARKAFNGCTGLTSVTIESRATKVDDEAFYGCSNAGFTTIVIPDTVTSIGSRIFFNCSSLKYITLPFVGASSSSSDKFGYVFNGSTNTDNIPSDLEVTITGGQSSYTLPKNAFLGCLRLKKITLKSMVTIIDESAFSGCGNLTSVTIQGSGLNRINASAFKDCASLTSIFIPTGVTVIGEGAFTGCSGLTEITLPFVGGSSSAGTASRSTLFGYVFGTTSYVGGTSVTQSYGSGSETYCIPSGLKKITISGGKIYEGAFSNMTEIEIVVLGDAITSIARGAFNNNQSLKELTIPFVGSGAYRSDSTKEDPQCLFGYIFAGTEMTNGTTVGQAYGLDGTGAALWYTSYIPSTLTKVTVTGGVLQFGAFDRCTMLQTIVIQSSNITIIPQEVFYECTALSTLTLPSGYTTIGKSAFYNCYALTSFTVPATVTSIGEYAFSECTNLTDIYFGGTKNKWRAFGTAWKKDYSGHITVHCSNGDLEY